MTLRGGTRFGPYEIVSPLGAGGMGEVYRAKDTRLDRTVAIKILLTSVATGDEARQRFLREAKVVSSLNHPNICALYDIGHENGVDFLVMEYIEGQTLADRLTKGPLSIKELLQCAIPIADALDKAHRQGLVHRDLKPGNIMLTKDGAKLLDFGLAKLQPSGVIAASGADRSRPLTVEGTIVGTLQYMSPEQLEGRDADARSDIFAFGAVLHEMATGKPAFNGSSQASLMAAILMEDPPSIRDSQPLSPQALDRTARQCLAKNPNDRWQTAGDLKRELAWISTHQEAGNVAPRAIASGSGPGRINRISVASLLISVAALITVAGLWMFGGSEKPSINRKYALTVTDLEADFMQPAVISPDGRRILYVANKQLWLHDLTQFDAQPIQNATSTNGISAFWSPDSKQIAYGLDGKLWRQAIGSEQRAPLCVIPESGRISGGCWAPSGKVVFSVWRGGLYETNQPGGNPRQLLSTDSLMFHDFHTPQFLPDGKTILLFIHAKTDERSGIGVLPDGSSIPKMLMEHASARGVSYSPTGHLLYTLETEREIWAVPFSTSSLELTGSPFQISNLGSHPTFSEDGLMVYSAVSAVEKVQMIRISLDGSEIVPLGQPIVGWSTPAFTMDGRGVFYTAMGVGRGNIWQFDLARGTHTRVTSDSSTQFTPIWLPSRNGYLLNRALGVSNGTLEILDPSTGTISQVIGEGLSHNVSPDGHYITFSTDVMGNIDLWYIDVRDPAMTRRPLLQTPQSEDAASIAPNGQWFSYTLLADGVTQVFLRRFPDARDPIQVSVDGGDQPFWHPSGRTLYSLTDSTLMEVDVTWEDPPKLSLPRAKFHSRNLDLTFIRSWDTRGNIAISPDGTFFVAGKRLIEKSAGRLHIVENWFEAFRHAE